MNQFGKRFTSMMLAINLFFSVIPTSVFASGMEEEVQETAEFAQNDTYYLSDGEICDSEVESFDVEDVPISGINLNINKLTLTVGDASVALAATVLPDDATDKIVIWDTSSDEVATVNDGLVTPMAEGSAIISAQAGGFVAECMVIVLPIFVATDSTSIEAKGIVDVTGISLSESELELTAGGQTATLTATITPEDATDKTVTWSSSSDAVATVVDGIVTPVSEGTATISAKAGNATAECVVTVKPGSVAVTGIALDKETLELTVGGASAPLTVKIDPENATNKTVVWKSDTPTVATVENGVVTPVAMGTAVITATTEDGGFSASCTVKVWGSCGDAAKWFVDGTKLVISGSGAISDSPSQLKQPWKSQKRTITTVELGSDITSIGKFSFAMSSNLTEVIIPEDSKLEVIGSSAFKTTAKLSSITLPGTLKRIDDETIAQKELHFRGTAEQWEALDYPGENVYVLKDGKEEKYVPDPYNGTCGISAIWHFDEETGVLTISGTGAMKDYASAAKAPWYQHRDKIIKVAIEAGVTSVGEYAFGGYAAVESVELADTVTVLGKYAFQANTKLSDISLSGVSKIGDYTFDGCTGLARVELDSAQEIGRNAFYGCSGLTSVSLGSETIRVVSMGIRAFENCSNLKTVTFANVENVSDYSFKGTAVVEVDLTGVKTIGGAFDGVSTLEKVTLSAGLTKIGGAAFSSTGITEIVIPGTVTDMGNGAFSKCVSMKKAALEDGIVTIPYLTFQNNTVLAEVTLPTSLQSVGQYAFDGCSALNTVNYAGTIEQWQQIEIAANNEPLLKAKGIVDVTGISLSESELELTAGGQTATLTATITPEDATDKTVTWSSSSDAVATVVDGIVTPVSEGTATISAKAGNATAECVVTVKPGSVAVTGIALDKETLELTVGGASAPLTVKIDPENATNKTVVWKSDTPTVATVENGVVTPVAMGTAVITATTEDGGFSASCTVKVEQSDSVYGLSEFAFTLEGAQIDDYIGENKLEIIPSGGNAYQLVTPVCAVIGSQPMHITITAPEGYEDEYTVTYTTWNNGDGGSHCYGEKTATSTNGVVIVKDYYNSWAPPLEGKIEYSDFVIHFDKENSEYKVSLSLYDDLNRLLVYPAGTNANEAPNVVKTGLDTYSATVVRGEEYTIMARGGAYAVGVPCSKLSISDGDELLATSTNHNSVSLNYTPSVGTEKRLAIKITNELTSPKIAEKIYTLILKVVDPPEKKLEFEKYTATLNGENVAFDGTSWRIPKITQGDELKITVHMKNDLENATYQWKCGLGGNSSFVGDNSSTVLVDTSSLALRDYFYRCIITYGNQTLTTPMISVGSINGKTLPTPVIKQQPKSAVYKLGGAATVLTVEKDEDSYLTHYQWYVSDEPDIAKGKAIDGETKYYYLPPTNEAGTLYYFCELYNTMGDVSSDRIQSAFAEIIVDSSDTPWKGDGTASSPFVLSTEADLLALSERVAEGQSFTGIYFQLANSISLSSGWKPIGTTKDGSGSGLYGKNMLPFSGILDGNDCVVTIPSGGKPLFNYVRQATIQNLRIQGVRIEGYGLIDHYEVDYGDLGVYAPDNVPETVRITNCRILEGTSIRDSGFLGGYASASNVVRISGCTVDEGVIIGYGVSDGPIGSLAGEFNGYVENCTSAATVKGTNKVGGLIGAKGQSMGPCEIRNCTFTGTVESNGSAGGILGNGYDAGSAPNSPCVTIIDCKVSGTVSGANYVGGILGAEGVYITQCWGNGVGIISNNEFTGTIQSSGNYVGGIIGYMCSINKYNLIENNYYAENCGAEKGIGFIKYVDTSCESHETESGAIYFNTANGLPGITGVSTKELNRTDDPLGADKDKLCFSKKRTEAYVKSIAVSGTYKTEYLTDEKFDATGIIVTATWSNGDVTTPAISEVTFTGFNSSEPGDVTITAQYRDSSTTFVLHIKPKSSVITVKVSVLGDTNHGDNGSAHGLKMGGLTPWVPEMSVEANTDETVWDVLKRVFDQKGLSADTTYNSVYGSIYIKSINGLGEFDNGKYSGWMYTVNGTHPEVGVSAKYLKQGDVVILHYTDDYTKEVGGMTPVEKPGTAQKVIDLINKIGTVTYTDACKQRIDAARSAYDALTATEKSKVGTNNLATLTKAEAEYKRLMQAGATDVDNLISKIGTVTANSGPAISNAWNAYNALTAEQKALVKKFNTLQEATQKWNQLKADEVVKLIDKIEEPVTEKSKASIEAARKAFDGLTDAQKRLVTNTKKLTDAEKAYAQLTATPEDKEKAQKVIDLIKKLTNVTLDSEKDIQAARKAYDALTDLQKPLVDNYDVLTTAETKLAMLKAMGKVSDPYISTGDYMEKLGTPGIGSIGGEWMVIGLARSGRTVPGVEDYYKKALEYIESSIDPETGRLHKAKSTDNSRMILALTAIGKDVTNVGGHNLLAGLSDLEYVKYQGNNGPIWALLALDSGNYPVPSGGTVTRQALIDEILRVQTSDGGWTVSGDKADSDMTGMALTALAPYYTKDLKVQEAIDKAIARLSEMQDEDGGYSTSYDGTTKIATSESISQVVTALSALGINADTAPRFVKNGNSVIDALLRYYVKGGGFKHIMDGELDGMATEQAYYALTAYYRFLSGKTNLYDMTDIIDMGGDPVEIPTEPTVPATTEPTEVEPAKTGFPWWILVICVVGGCGLGMVIAIVIIPKFGKFKKKD